MDRPCCAKTALSVLIVEDNALIGVLLAELLEGMGHKACGIVATEDEAVAEAARLQPGLMLVDVNLAAGSGIAAMRRVLKSGPRPFVFMCGLPDQVGWPNVTTLRKPFTAQELELAIDSALGAVTPTPLPSPQPTHSVRS